MAPVRLLTVFTSAAAIAGIALAIITANPTSPTPVANAGPCADVPLLFFGPVAPFGEDDGILPLYTTTNKAHVSPTIEVDTVPSVLPQGKDPVTVTVKTTHLGIDLTFDPDEGNGDFDTTLTVVIGDVPPGLYEFDIEVYCHELTTTYVFEVWIDQCPTGAGPSSAIASNGEPWPSECSEPSPTAEPTPTSNPTPTDTPTPTEHSGQAVVWGNHNCSGNPLGPPDPVDALLNLRHDAGLSTNTGDCPDMGATVTQLIASGQLTWGDADCSGAADPVDALKILRFDSGLSVSQTEPCPDLGMGVTLALG
ncbi:MAG TPA: hypothetical protein VMR52_10600 [Dehalococcoidia bacterium]|nr:hypothetical protein [Dehalococcoidia bacterium]